jgi:hypothetical protein
VAKFHRCNAPSRFVRILPHKQKLSNPTRPLTNEELNMVPAAERRQLMNDFGQPVRQAAHDAAVQGIGDATMLLLDLRDDRAQKMAVDFADLSTLRNIVATAEQEQSAPVLIACATSAKAATIMRSNSKKSNRKFAARVPTNRFRLIVVGSGGITWALGATDGDVPSN